MLRCSWLACERVRRAQRGRETQLSTSMSVCCQPKSPQSLQSSTRAMAPPGALGGAWCSGARGSRVSVCGALRDSTQCICERLEPAKIVTDSAIEHPGDGATGGARGPLVLRCSWHACERLTSDGRRVVDAHVRASRTDCCYRRRQDCLLPPIPAIKICTSLTVVIVLHTVET